MALCRRKIDQATLTQYVDPVSVSQSKFFDKFPNHASRLGNAFQTGQVQFNVKMTGVGDNRPILHE